MIHESDTDDLDYEAPFTAKLTGRTDVGGVWYYDWTEQAIDPDTGGLVDADPGRVGEVGSGAARERNNAGVDVPSYAELRFRGVEEGGAVFEFDAGASAGTTNTTYNYTTDTFNYTDDTFNFYGANTLNVFDTLIITGVGTLTINTKLEICDDLFLCWDTLAISGSQANDLVLPSDAGGHTQPVVRLDAVDGPLYINGMVAEGPGHAGWFTNVGDYSIILTHENAGSAAANRFKLPRSAELEILKNAGFMAWWDEDEDEIDANGRWKVIEPILDTSAFLTAASMTEHYEAYFRNTYSTNTRLYIAGTRDGNFDTSNVTTLASGHIFAYPIVLPRGGTIRDLNVYVNAGAGSGAKIAMAVYDNFDAGRPYALNLLDQTAEIDVHDAGVAKQYTGTLLGGDLVLDPGIYWFAIWRNTTGTPNVRYAPGSACWGLLGYDTLSGAAGVGWDALATYAAGGVFPDPFPIGSAGVRAPGTTTTAIHAIGVRFVG